MDYLEIDFKIVPKFPWADILLAELADLGFESFAETEDGFLAYAPVSIGNVETILANTSVFSQKEVQIFKTEKIIPHQNWNAQWEADFEPVLVGNRLAILAPFHNKAAFNTAYLVEIQPQMSFGTGHHQTTHLMSEYLLDLDPMPVRVLDMGTGTGVLAILAEMRGAKEIVAVDIEPWSVENTIENAQRNHCTHIQALLGDVDVVFGGDFGVILANINKNILKQHLPVYAKLSSPNGLLYLSGFFLTDVPELEHAANEVGYKVLEVREKETWAAIKLQKL
jgi:ribosomal protein L11 methyltransferase